jgi:hypothetical protein
MTNEAGISKRLERKLRRHWAKLTEGRNYLVPETREDFTSLGPFPYFRLGNLWVYAKESIRETVAKASEELRAELGPDLLSLASISDAIRSEIQIHFSQEEPQPFEWHLERLLSAIRAHDHRRLSIRAICGLKLTGMDEFSHGCWKIIRLSEQAAADLVRQDIGPEKWHEQLSSVMEKGFIGKTCILIEQRGDADQAGLKSDRVARYVLNTLRLFISIHASQAGLQHRFGVHLDAPGHQTITQFSFDLDAHRYNLHHAFNSHRQEYTLTAESLRIIRENWQADQLWALLEKVPRTDLEESVVTAVAWFGGAQAESDSHLGFVKYWVAMEALVPGSEDEKVVVRLKKFVPILVSQISREVPSKTKVAKAYDLRSQIMHSGSRVELTQEKLNEVSNWAWQCIVTALYLSSRGYATRKQVEEQILRIDASSANTASGQEDTTQQ